MCPVASRDLPRQVSWNIAPGRAHRVRWRGQRPLVASVPDRPGREREPSRCRTRDDTSSQRASLQPGSSFGSDTTIPASSNLLGRYSDLITLIKPAIAETADQGRDVTPGCSHQAD